MIEKAITALKKKFLDMGIINILSFYFLNKIILIGINESLA